MWTMISSKLIMKSEAMYEKLQAKSLQILK